MCQIFTSASSFSNLNFFLSKKKNKEDCYQHGFNKIGSHSRYTQQNILIAAYLFKYITQCNWSYRTYLSKCAKRQIFFNMFLSDGGREVFGFFFKRFGINMHVLLSHLPAGGSWHLLYRSVCGSLLSCHQDCIGCYVTSGQQQMQPDF